MKKRTVIISTLFLIILSAIILTSCNIFSKNKDRIENETAFTIEYEGQKETITKKELELAIKNELNKQLYNNPQYMYILQLAPQLAPTYAIQILENIKTNIVEIITKEKIKIMIAKKEFSPNDPSKKSFDILLDWEKKYVIDSLNEQIINQFISSSDNTYSAYLTKIQSENQGKENNNNNKENLIEQYPDIEPRPNVNVSSNDETIKRIPNQKYKEEKANWKNKYFTSLYGNDKQTDQNIVKENVRKLVKFICDNKIKNTKYQDFAKNAEQMLELNKKQNRTKEDEQKLIDLINVYKDAYLDTLKIFKDRPYEKLLSDMSDNELLLRYNEKLTNDELVKDYKNQIKAAYDKTIDNSSTKWTLSENGFKNTELINSGDNLYIHPMLKYDEENQRKMSSVFGVQVINFKFTNEQKDVLDNVKRKYGVDSQEYYTIREDIALGTGEYKDESLGLKTEKGIKIYISNLEYNSTLDKTLDNSPFELDKDKSTSKKLVYKSYTYKEILKMISEDMKKSDKKVEEEYKNASDFYKNEKNTQIITNRLKVFERWINKVNDDKKYFADKNKGKYPINIVTTEGKITSTSTIALSEEVATLSRKILEKNKTQDYIASTMNADNVKVNYEKNGQKYDIRLDSDSNIGYVVDDSGINIVIISNYGVFTDKDNYTYYNKEGKEVDGNNVNEVLFVALKLDAKTNGRNSYTYEEVLKREYVNSVVKEKTTKIIDENAKKAKVNKNKKLIEKVIKEQFPKK